MAEKDDKKRRNSLSVVRPYARIRIVIAVLCVLIAFAVIAYRSVFG